MNSTQSASTSASAAATEGSGPGLGSVKKVRKPYTITKSRECWTDEEHDKFLEALQLFDRDWKKIEDFVGSKTVIQIRSHAQKYFLKVQKNGTAAHVPPPRPKRKATHPYPQKSQKYVSTPTQASIVFCASWSSEAPGYPVWDDASVLMNASTADVGSEGFSTSTSKIATGVGNSSTLLLASVLPTQEKGSMLLGLPDFAEVYSFIGGVFDPDTKGHEDKLKGMDPISFETVLLLMKNLTMNLSGPDFEPIKKVLSSYKISGKSVTLAASDVAKHKTTHVPC